jgi:26S proteasome regulatory subunit T2
MEAEFIQNQKRLKPQEERHKEERSKVDKLRGTAMAAGNLEEIIDDQHAIVSLVSNFQSFKSTFYF